ncbi:MAG TPA: histidine phosphatase family protein [Micromonosporaceae bacterium]|nr:histidine phosphatase family protein [Micromonosporaceae bacterium]
MTPSAVLLAAPEHQVAGWTAAIHEVLPTATVVSTYAMPAPSAELRRELAVTLAVKLVHRGASAVVAGDLGSSGEREALCLRLGREGIAVAVVADGAGPSVDRPAGAAAPGTPALHGLLAGLGRAGKPGHRGSHVVLLRHGHASHAGPGFPSGTDLALSPRGRAEAVLAAEALRAYRPDVVYCSSLRRARQTAAVVVDLLGGAGVIADPRLNEREFAPLYGMTDRQIRDRYGDRLFDAFTTMPDAVDLDGVQSLRQCQERVVAFFASLARHAPRRPLVVAHGGPFAWWVSHVMGMPLEHSRRWRMGYGALSTVHIGPSATLLRWNADRVHPDALP